MEWIEILLLCFATAIIVVGYSFFVYKNKKKEQKIRRLTCENSNLLAEKENNEANAKLQIQILKANVEQSRIDLENLNGKIKTIEAELNLRNQESREKEKEIDEVEKKLFDEQKQKKQAKDELERTQSELSELKEKIVEYEGEIENYKCMQKESLEEIKNLEEDLDDEQKQKKQAKDELERTQSESKNIKKGLEIKEQSLLLIQDVFFAKPIANRGISVLYDNVKDMCDFVSGDMRETIDRLGLYVEQRFFDEDLKKWEATTKKDWIDGKKVIAFIGQFSAGKTSIVNRILSLDNQKALKLPTDVFPSTAIPTYISACKPGEISTQYNLITPNNERKSIDEITFKRVTKDVLKELKGMSSLIQYFVMEYKSDNLENLSILDTPGFSSGDTKDAQRTIEAINECDALFWVLSVSDGGLNTTSIELLTLIKENIKKPLYIVINKIDQKAPEEVDEVKDDILKTLQDNSMNVEEIICFSQHAPLEDIMKHIRSIHSNKGQSDYLHNLKDYLNKLCSQLKDDETKASQNLSVLRSGENTLKSKLRNDIYSLQKTCSDVKVLPEKTSTFFGGEKFKLSVEKYQKMKELLDGVSNKISGLSNLHDDQMKHYDKIRHASDDYIKKKENWNKLVSCRDKLNKLIDKLNKPISKL